MLNAKVTRPAFNESLTDHPAVRLTAKATSGSVSKEVELFLRVKMQGITDSQAVILDLNDIVIKKETKLDLDLPTIGKNGSKITWSSSNSDIITNAGVVSRPNVGEEDATVTLTATCTKGSESQTKEFQVVVSAWTVEEEIEEAATLVTWDLIKGANTNSQAITSDLVLPETVGRGVKATWSTSSTNLEISTGKITRPSYTQGQVTLSIVCALEHKGQNRTISLPVFIISPLAMTNQEVIIAAKNLLEASTFLGNNESLSKITENMLLPFRVNDVDASRATIAWSLAAHTTHTDLLTHANIELKTQAENVLATITRPSTGEGNAKVALKATISVGDGGSKVEETKFFDLTILVES